MKIKLLQWNILYSEKAGNIFKTLKKIGADVICLQEITTRSKFNPEVNTVAFIAKNLRLNAFFHHSQTWVHDGIRAFQGNAIFSRYPIKSKIALFLEKGLDNTTSDQHNGNRSYLEAVLKFKNRKLRIGTTHLAFSPDFKADWKRKDAKRLLRIVKNRKKNYILTGDLNAAPDSRTITNLKKHLRHGGPDYKQKTWTTKPFDYLGMRETKLRWRLDYVFATPDVKIINSKILKTPYSDHLPILVEFDI